MPLPLYPTLPLSDTVAAQQQRRMAEWWQKVRLTYANDQSALAPVYKTFSLSNPWLWTHNLGYRPVIQAFDLNGNVLDINPQHLDNNSLSVTLSAATAGVLVATPSIPL